MYLARESSSPPEYYLLKLKIKLSKRNEIGRGDLANMGE
jgi:hypothetical protein